MTNYSASVYSESTQQIADGSLRDFISLLKPRVMSLVVFSGALGLVMAPNDLHPLLSFTTLLCIALATGGSAAVNMWYDRDIDLLMTRTIKRALPDGRMAPHAAAEFGTVLIIISILLQGMAVNWQSAALLSLAVFIYVFVYTFWLKRLTRHNIVIGGLAGALPPAISWAAATGDIFNATAWQLVLMIFLWTPAHFWALAMVRSDEYARAGVPMLPVVSGVEHTKKHILFYAILTVLSSFMPFFTKVSGTLYLVGALLLGGAFLYSAVKMLRGKTLDSALGLFKMSIIWLFGIILLMMVDHALA